jgi:hypothetical protein
MKCVASEPPWRTFDAAPLGGLIEPKPTDVRQESAYTSGSCPSPQFDGAKPYGAGRGFDEHTVNTFEVDQRPGCGAGARLDVRSCDNPSAYRTHARRLLALRRSRSRAQDYEIQDPLGAGRARNPRGVLPRCECRKCSPAAISRWATRSSATWVTTTTIPIRSISMLSARVAWSKGRSGRRIPARRWRTSELALRRVRARPNKPRPSSASVPGSETPMQGQLRQPQGLPCPPQKARPHSGLLRIDGRLTRAPVKSRRLRCGSAIA